MGLYDTVIVPCPKCGKQNDRQSKAGKCTMSEYTIDDAPLNVLMDIDGETIRCDCGHIYSVRLHRNVSIEID
jgi:hypothetical protein